MQVLFLAVIACGAIAANRSLAAVEMQARSLMISLVHSWCFGHLAKTAATLLYSAAPPWIRRRVAQGLAPALSVLRLLSLPLHCLQLLCLPLLCLQLGEPAVVPLDLPLLCLTGTVLATEVWLSLDPSMRCLLMRYARSWFAASRRRHSHRRRRRRHRGSGRRLLS